MAHRVVGSDRKPGEGGRFLILALLGSTLGITLIAIFPVITLGTRLAPWLGLVGGFAYARVYWATRLGRIKSQTALLTLSVLVVVPSIGLALTGVPYSAILYSTGFLIATTGGMWLVAAVRNDSPER